MCKFLALILLLLAAFDASAQTVSPCEIAATPNKYAGQVIVLAATFRTDLLEYSSLTDRRCPGVVIAPYDVEGPKHPSVIKFDRAVAGKFQDHSARVFFVVAVGTYEPDVSSRNGRFTIYRVLRFNRSSPRLRPNNSFKPKPLRGSA